MRTSPPRTRGLPRPLSSFIGREAEIRAVCELLLSGARLVTLTGPGGVGKTRLAVAVAESLATGFDGQIVFVSLAPLSDARLVEPTIARALGVDESTGKPPWDRLIERLRGRKTAIVLDNVEHVVQAAPDIATLLHACPDLLVLATGRQPLRLQGEYDVAVQPLRLPEAAAADGPAVQLFVSRAQQVDRRFQLTDANRKAVVAICRRLDGLPLAIELATARLKVLAIDELLRRLDDPLALLTGGPRDAPDRQQTMRATIEWSYDVLSSAEQTLFCQMSVFAGGATLAGIEAVADGDAVIDDLHSLVEQGLVLRVAGSGKTARYNMLEPIRQFAHERLQRDDGELSCVRRRHAHYYRTSVRDLRKRIDGPDGPDELRRVDREIDNVRVALTWLHEQEEIDAGLQMVGDLGMYWFQIGNAQEGMQAAMTFLNHPSARDPSRFRAAALWTAVWLELPLGGHESARRFADELLDIGNRLDDSEARAHALFTAGVCFRPTDPARAVELWTTALDTFRTCGDYAMVVRGLGQLGMQHVQWGRLDQARVLLEEGYDLAGDHGLARGLVINGLARVSRSAGDDARAVELLRESLLEYMALRSPWAGASILQELAQIARRRGSLEDAVWLLSLAEHMFNRSGVGPFDLGVGHLADAGVEDLRQLLSAERFDAAWSEGKAATVADAHRRTEALLERPDSPGMTLPDDLTPREAEVLALIAVGRSNRQMADDLYLSVRTIERHVANIYRKIDVHNRTEATRYAIRHRLVDTPTT